MNMLMLALPLDHGRSTGHYFRDPEYDRYVVVAICGGLDRETGRREGVWRDDGDSGGKCIAGGAIVSLGRWSTRVDGAVWAHETICGSVLDSFYLVVS